MSAFKYETKIGSYDDPVTLEIDLKVEGGLSIEDYEKIKAALNTVEKTALLYRDSYMPEAPTLTQEAEDA